jgi:hypothetical protein
MSKYLGLRKPMTHLSSCQLTESLDEVAQVFEDIQERGLHRAAFGFTT